MFNFCGVNFWEVVGYYNVVYYIIDKNLFGKVKLKKMDMFDILYEIFLN